MSTIVVEMPKLHIEVSAHGLTDIYLMLITERSLYFATWCGFIKVHAEIIDLNYNPELSSIHDGTTWDAETVQNLISFVGVPVD